jgi:hypothetical protein
MYIACYNLIHDLDSSARWLPPACPAVLGSVHSPAPGPQISQAGNETMSNELKMPFGKHRGKPVVSIPESYLRWLAENVELREPLRGAVAVVLMGKAEQMPLGVPGSTLGARSSSVGSCTPPPAHSYGVNRGSQHREAAKPKRPWIPRQENLSEYYTPQGVDDIPW